MTATAPMPCLMLYLYLSTYNIYSMYICIYVSIDISLPCKRSTEQAPEMPKQRQTPRSARAEQAVQRARGSMFVSAALTQVPDTLHLESQ